MTRQSLTMTIDEAGELLGVSRNSAYQAARKGEIPVIRIGKRMLVPRAEFERMLNPSRAAGSGEGKETATA